MNIAVIGAGAIGGWLAARLALAGHRVAAFSSGGPVDALSISESGRRETVRLSRRQEPAELLILAVKAPALAKAASAAQPYVEGSSMVLPALNGVPWWFVDDEPLRSIDPDRQIATLLPQDRVVGCVVHASCSRTATDEVAVHHAEKLVVGEPGGGESKRVEALAALFEDAGIRVEQSRAVRQAIWYKLWGNATLNPLSALTRVTADRLIADPAIRAFLLAGMAELAAVGAAIGCAISQSGEDRLAVTKRLGAFKTSMLQDLEAGRALELDALLGAPREIALRHGIATPNLDLLYSLTSQLAGANRG
jgi:2-dehydropantoate 2-reductase